jgi:transcriptional regulator with XRE-family HTH domain
MPAVTSAARTDQVSPVGRLLRDWRAARGLSQLDLALQTGFSARHVSFIETGRTQPSRQALIALAETLEVPLRDRNRLLEAAGYAAVYRRTPLAAQEMAHVRSVLEFILERHKPYAAVVHDRYANCIMGNDVSASLIAAIVDPSLLVAPVNYLRITFHPLGARRWIVNWDEVAQHLLGRAERELAALGDDPTARALLEEIHGYAGTARARSAASHPAADLLLPIHIRKDDLDLRMFSTIMTLGTPQDVTLQELRIETFFPVDQTSEETWLRVTRAL